MSLMLAVAGQDIPSGNEWNYELKYDGYRAQLIWEGSSCTLLSRNQKDLSKQFPEIIESCRDHFTESETLQLDGEIILFTNPGLADFHALKRRHRLRSNDKILVESQKRPAYFLAFDLLECQGQSTRSWSYIDRKKELRRLFKHYALPKTPVPHDQRRVQYVPATENAKDIKALAHLYRSEGIVAKTSRHPYANERSEAWVKVKTPHILTCFILSYQPSNGYFEVGVFRSGQAVTVGQCAHGFSKAEKETLVTIVKNNGRWDQTRNMYDIEPSIVVTVAYTTYADDFREPRFQSFKLNTPARQCTWENWLNTALKWPEHVSFTHPEKPLWVKPEIYKRDFLEYVRTVAPYVLPHLRARLLTVVRYPHGTFAEAFFQKQCPDYAPSFVDTLSFEDTDYIVCNHVDTLLWLANQLAIEWHIPFSLSTSAYVEEIVIDLDPPDAKAFLLAIEGAAFIKEIFEQLQLTSFVKFSGNKGLQVYLPLIKNRYTYEDTHPFTEAIGAYCLQRRPDLFTRERLKKNRGRKLYIDIPQHAFGKTIIAPYSLRGNDDALIACPLFWEEVNKSLDRSQFTHKHVQERLLYDGCPFYTLRDTENELPDFG
ncbi:bifunctional non-homologous end joining protein LigD [Geomicrobium halophilum]|uniref:Bifunctional non-homologous end joining protein LigD n=1 Tax=Geomicrobium halophilum TaxID=549000 RepID=A0A841Q045_9BACL|nr:DNA ligase D [Geomicrobium halophilum]MBB6450662.1 bifunctional non-homologous end joining protein LigD [Geomicrobium halophilum]